MHGVFTLGYLGGCGNLHSLQIWPVGQKPKLSRHPTPPQADRAGQRADRADRAGQRADRADRRPGLTALTALTAGLG